MNEPQIIQLPKISDPRGNLSFFENLKQIPFELKRVFWIYDVPGGAERGSHAYYNTEEFIVAISGSFDVILDDGKGNRQTYHMNRSYYGLYIPPMYWCEVVNFSTNSLCMVCASRGYEEEEYMHNFDEFCKEVAAHQNPVVKGIGTEVNGQSPFISQKSEKGARQSSVFDCTMIELDKHHSERKGNLTVVENGIDLPFDVKRAYYLYDIPGGESRGAHAHKNLQQLIVAASGSFTVVLDDGKVKRSFFLNRPYQGLLVSPGIWRDLVDFSSGSVLLCLANEGYEETDYIRSYQDFVNYKK